MRKTLERDRQPIAGVIDSQSVKATTKGNAKGRFTQLCHILADSGFAGPKLRTALLAKGSWTIDIIRRSNTVKEVKILPWGGVVDGAIG